MGIVAALSVVVAVVVVARSQNVTSAKRGRGTRYVAGVPPRDMLHLTVRHVEQRRVEGGAGSEEVRCGKPQKCCMREAFTVVATAEQLLQPRQPKCR